MDLTGTQRIYAFDPGGTTGVAVMSMPPGNVNAYMGTIATSTLTYAATFIHIEGVLRAQFKAGTLTPASVIFVFERFRLRPEARMQLTWNDFPAVEKAGYIIYMAARLKVELVEQSPAIMSHWADRILRKECPIPLPGTEHEKDAIRHLLHFWFTMGGRHYYAKH